MQIRVTGTTPSSDTFRSQLRTRWDDLGLDPSDLTLLRAAATPAPVAVLFDPDQLTDTEAAAHAATADLVIPVLPDAPSAAGLPATLQAVNAFLIDRIPAAWADALVDEVLSAELLPRRTRRVFISYRRLDATGVAQQLHAHLVKLGFEVFLDTVGLASGVAFQPELYWWLHDADLILVLASPRALDSTWVRKEIEFARSSYIGLVQLRWPAACYRHGPRGPAYPRLGEVDSTGTVALDAAELTASVGHADFAGTADAPRHQLTEAGLARVIEHTLALRLRCVWERWTDLLGLARLEAEMAGTVTQGPAFGELVVTHDGERTLHRVTPCRPDPLIVKRAHSALGPAEADRLCLRYPENAPQDDRAVALRWLVADTDRELRPLGTPW